MSNKIASKRYSTALFDSVKNEELDAQWFANEVASQIPKAINKNFEFSERPYSVNDVMVGKIEK